MDNIASQILHGCKLAGELEANLPNLVNQSQHNLLIESCEQVVQTFSKAIQQLTTSKVDRSSCHGFIGMEKTIDLVRAGATIGQEETPVLQIPPSKVMQKLISKVHGSSHHGFIGMEKTDDVVHAGATIGQEETPLALPEKQMGNPDTAESVEMIGPRIGPASAIQRGEESSTDAAMILIGSSGESSSGVASMASNKMKKRQLTLKGSEWKNRHVKHTVLVPAQGVGKNDVPPDDGFKWRKYGKKSLLGAMFPRSYYRCIKRGCGAKKRVQKLPEDPPALEIVYCGIHTCGISSFSMPKITPPTNLEHNQQSQSQSISIQLGTWSSGEVQCSATNANVYSVNKTGTEAIVMHDCDSSDSSGSSSVHILPQQAKSN